ncbi:MAG: ice-binding family protein [Solirubrobacteraceae bacterium]
MSGSDALAAQPPVGLGTADSFAVLAGSTVTNTGPSTVNGDLGVSPGAAVTGFPPGTVNGTIHAVDAVATQAQSDLTTAYNDAAGRTPAVTVSGDLGGQTLTAGVYKSASSLGLTGTLTLNAQGDPNAVFIFQAGSTLTTASGSHVNLINGAQPCNVFWQVGSSATLGTTSVFSGDILALTSISMDNRVTDNGAALARNGAVTLIDDTITAAHCTTAPAGHNGRAAITTAPPSVAKTIARFGTGRCVSGRFRAVVTGHLIRQVVFSEGGRIIATVRKAPFEVSVAHRAGIHTVMAHVTFTDSTAAKTLKLRFRSCAAAKRHVHHPSRPPRGPVGFTG